MFLFFNFIFCACSSTADWSLRSSYEVSSVSGGLARGARSETFDDGTSSVFEDEEEEDDEQEDVDIPIEAQLSKEADPDWYVPFRADACM